MRWGGEMVGGVARLPERDGEGEGWRVEVGLGGGDRMTMRPGWVLDCTGRAGVLARRHRVLETDAPTLAVIRRYENAAGWPNVDPTHALVESFERGWGLVGPPHRNGNATLRSCSTRSCTRFWRVPWT